eukprot:4418128-Amphidinium_carterae.1
MLFPPGDNEQNITLVAPTPQKHYMRRGVLMKSFSMDFVIPIALEWQRYSSTASRKEMNKPVE